MTLIDDGKLARKPHTVGELGSEVVVPYGGAQLTQQQKIDEWNAAHAFAPSKATPAQMSPYGVSRKRRRAIVKGEECRPKKRQPSVCFWSAVNHRCTLDK